MLEGGFYRSIARLVRYAYVDQYVGFFAVQIIHQLSLLEKERLISDLSDKPEGSIFQFISSLTAVTHRYVISEGEEIARYFAECFDIEDNLVEEDEERAEILATFDFEDTSIRNAILRYIK